MQPRNYQPVPISQELQKVEQRGLVPATTVWKPLKIGLSKEENKLALALQPGELRFRDADVEQRTALLRSILLLIGIRAANLPNQMEREFLAQEIDEEYGRHTLQEIMLAFRMAVHGKLMDVNDKVLDANCYENFSIGFFAKIMGAYKRWSNRIIPHLFKEEPPPVPSFHDTHAAWQKIIEVEFQIFREGKDRHQLWVEAFYETLVYDDLIEPFRFEKEQQRAKSELVGPMYKKVNELKTDMRMEKMVRYNAVMDLTKEINAIKGGSKDTLILLQCKQISVAKFFAECIEKGKQTIYIFPEIQLSELRTRLINEGV